MTHTTSSKDEFAATSALERASYCSSDSGDASSSNSDCCSSVDEEELCWICLDPAREDAPLQRMCHCPRKAHGTCLARWQLHCAGTQEEKKCRFCSADLPDWKGLLISASKHHVQHKSRRSSPPGSEQGSPRAQQQTTASDEETPSSTEAALPPAYMRISYNGRSHKIRVLPGPTGERQFVKDCRRLLKIPPWVDFDVVFHCREPCSGSQLQLKGLNAFDAAVHCAAVAPPVSQAEGAGAGAGDEGVTEGQGGRGEGAGGRGREGGRAAGDSRVAQDGLGDRTGRTGWAWPGFVNLFRRCATAPSQ